MVAVCLYAVLNLIGWVALRTQDWRSFSIRATDREYFSALHDWAAKGRGHIAISALGALVAIPVAVALRCKVSGGRLALGLFIVIGLAVSSFMTLAWDAFGMGV